MSSNQISGAMSLSARCFKQPWKVRRMEEQLHDVQDEQGLILTCSACSLRIMLPWSHIRCRDLAGVMESPCQPAGPPFSKQFYQRYDKSGW